MESRGITVLDAGCSHWCESLAAVVFFVVQSPPRLPDRDCVSDPPPRPPVSSYLWCPTCGRCCSRARVYFCRSQVTYLMAWPRCRCRWLQTQAHALHVHGRRSFDRAQMKGMLCVGDRRGWYTTSVVLCCGRQSVNMLIMLTSVWNQQNIPTTSLQLTQDNRIVLYLQG